MTFDERIRLFSVRPLSLFFEEIKIFNVYRAGSDDIQSLFLLFSLPTFIFFFERIHSPFSFLFSENLEIIQFAIYYKEGGREEKKFSTATASFLGSALLLSDDLENSKSMRQILKTLRVINSNT